MRYEDVVLRDGPLAYWPLAETSGTVMKALVGTDGTHSASVNLAAEPAPMGGRAPYFGSAGSSVAVNLSAQSAITVELWLKPIGATGSGRALEFQSDWSGNAGSFLVQYDGAAVTGGTGNTTASASFLLPNTNSRWHHLMLYLNRATNWTGFTFTANGRPQTLSAGLTNTSGSVFANGTLLVGRYTNGVLQPLCPIAHVAIYSGNVTNLAMAHYRAGLRRQPGQP